MKTNILRLTSVCCAIILCIMTGLSLPTLNAQNCMMKPVSLQQRINNSSIVIEGRVVSKQSFWNVQKTMIFTQYDVTVYKYFKGSTDNLNITLLAEGGQVGDELITLVPNIDLAVGDVGIFDLTENNLVSNISFSNPAYQAYAGGQSFIRYFKNRNIISGVYDSYENIDLLYQKISSITHQSFVELSSFSAKDYLSIHANNNKSVVISSISPLTVTAGTYTEITINGSGFGTIPTSIWFHDANNTPNGIISPPTACNQIISWSDTQIKTYVPTQATSGTVYILGPDTIYYGSPQPLVVTYNITNSYLSSDGGATYKSFTFDLVNTNTTGGYTWTFNNDFYTNTNAVARFTYGLDLWRCATGVNWKTAGAATTATGISQMDGTNVISFDNTAALPAGTLGRATSFYDACQAGGSTYRYLKECDIIFNHTISWNFLTALPATNEYDFQSVSTHEIGHFVQQGHYGELGDVMHWALDSGMTARTLRPAYEILGANYVLTRNNANELAVIGNTGGSTVANPCGPAAMTLNYTGCSGSSTEEMPSGTNAVIVSPNPFNENTFLTFSNPDNDLLTLRIYDTDGRLVQQFEKISGESYKVESKNLTEGIYFFMLFSNQKLFGTGRLIAE
ncbi:MAG: T9SS type A sorting domain-containing protein [Bacteroidota bacterium]